ncbi:transposase [Citricoccus sp. NPDC079358]|uniref:transposase n=1 Tax=Citricoccus sp. NPDC079358 TaxID=3154653 RepID=UPI00344C7993
MTSGSPDNVRPTTLCAECRLIRGIVVATYITAPIAQAVQDPEPRVSDYRRLTDSQWNRIRSIVQPDEPTRRGRPRTDGRTLIDAALYRAHTGIPWRELPAEFGSWQTAATTADGHRRKLGCSTAHTHHPREQQPQQRHPL